MLKEIFFAVVRSIFFSGCEERELGVGTFTEVGDQIQNFRKRARFVSMFLVCGLVFILNFALQE